MFYSIHPVVRKLPASPWGYSRGNTSHRHDILKPPLVVLCRVHKMSRAVHKPWESSRSLCHITSFQYLLKSTTKPRAPSLVRLHCTARPVVMTMIIISSCATVKLKATIVLPCPLRNQCQDALAPTERSRSNQFSLPNSPMTRKLAPLPRAF